MTQDQPPPPVDKTREALRKLDNGLAHFARDVETLAERSGKHSLGVEVLLAIHRELSEDGIRAFTAWAVHSGCGFLPQTVNAKPLPERVAPVIDRVVAAVNAKIDVALKDKDFLARIRREEKTIHRRAFLRRAATGAVASGGLMGLIESSETPESKRIANLIIAMAGGGAMFGFVLPMALHYTMDGKDPQEFKRAPLKIIAPPTGRIDANKAARAACWTLQALLEPERDVLPPL